MVLKLTVVFHSIIFLGSEYVGRHAILHVPGGLRHLRSKDVARSAARGPQHPAKNKNRKGETR